MNYIGVRKRSGRYSAGIEYNTRWFSLGNYETAREAAIVRDEFVINYRLDRELNFPYTSD